ncbi:CheW protein [Rhodomicrobium vannielii ATCC 17100]|uniref:CheW protein n=1 Tax=Rhodomicrobium vannielii (strain ATCC 17100 / DSM 162 / LMG 4299 / NCIMB 10020 / ATH 3.1.1) TaxID=648757 RepID=E3I162_RHOVT|nr:chemotaxis protein CheW [Rhodomicrobium vannielii]ADP70075.1 CheW protein [Rhodomicrobium vannielii ATCC 17100]
MADQTHYVTLGVAGGLFAVPVESVQQILEIQPIAAMPNAPADFIGLIDVRGQNVPVIDLRAKLALPAAADTQNTRIIVLDVAVGGVTRRFALKTDQVFEVTGLDEGALEPPPDLGARWRADCVAGVGRRAGAFVTVLDLDQLFLADALASDGAVETQHIS